MNLGHNQWFHPPNRLIFTYGTPRLPPSGSTTGSALSPTPPRGGSDLEACIRRSSITPPLRGSRRSRAGWRRLMRWGGQPIPATSPTSTSTQALQLPPLRGSRRSRAGWRRLMRWGGAGSAPGNRYFFMNIDAQDKQDKQDEGLLRGELTPAMIRCGLAAARDYRDAGLPKAILYIPFVHVNYEAPRLPPLRLDGTPRLPPSGSTAGSALSPTPPQGGSDLERLMQASGITPPLRGSRRSRAAGEG